MLLDEALAQNADSAMAGKVYQRRWEREFQRPCRVADFMARVLLSSRASALAAPLLAAFPGLLRACVALGR